MSGRILIVEDEIRIAELLAKFLVRDNFLTHICGSGEAALAYLAEQDVDLLILDVRLPGMDGVQVCEHVRQTSDLPIIMITARVGEEDRLAGLERGADDYICKPFYPAEVVQRVKNLLRRCAAPADVTAPASIPDLLPEQWAVRIDGHLAQLTEIEFRLVQRLVEQPDLVHTREQLISAAYGDGSATHPRTIDSHFRKVRQKLAPLTADGPLIESVYGLGYRLRADQ